MKLWDSIYHYFISFIISSATSIIDYCNILLIHEKHTYEPNVTSDDIEIK